MTQGGYKIDNVIRRKAEAAGRLRHQSVNDKKPLVADPE
jgi:hypothetical protein